MNRSIITAALISAVLLLSACNTVRGIGRDVKSAGGAVEKAVD
jgi:predicted small secreted protein